MHILQLFFAKARVTTEKTPTRTMDLSYDFMGTATFPCRTKQKQAFTQVRKLRSGENISAHTV